MKKIGSALLLFIFFFSGCTAPEPESSKAAEADKLAKAKSSFVRPQGKDIWVDEKVLERHNLEVVWNLPIRGDSIDKMYLEGDSIYIYSPQEKFLHRIDRRSGIVKWSFRMKEGLSYEPVLWEYNKEEQQLTGISQSDEIVVVSQSRAYIIDKEFGVELSSIPLGEISPSSAPGIHKYNVYICGWDKRIYSYSKKDRVENWRFLANGDILCRPLGAPGFTKMDIVYVASTDGNVYGLNATNGQPAWNAPFHSYGKIMFPPVYHKQWLYVASNDSNLYCLNSATGLHKWSYICEAPIQSPPIAITTTVYALAKARFLYALQYGTGSLLWRYPATKDTVWLNSGKILTGEVLQDSETTDTLEIRFDDGKVEAIERGSIEKISWGAHKVNEEEAPVQILARSKNFLYVLNGKKEICAIDDNTGTMQWKIKAENVDFFVTNPAPYSEIKDRPDAGTIYLGFKEGWIIAIREKDTF